MKSENSWAVEKNKYNEIDVQMERNIKLTNEIGKVRQRLENKLRLFQGEWHLHNLDGMQWLNTEEQKGQIGNLLQTFNIEAQVREIILQDESVKEILEFKTNFSNDKGNYSFEVRIKLNDGKEITL